MTVEEYNEATTCYYHRAFKQSPSYNNDTGRCVECKRLRENRDMIELVKRALREYFEERGGNSGLTSIRGNLEQQGGSQ